VRREISIDDVFTFIGIREKATIQDIRKIFNLDHAKTFKILDFLFKFDFVKFESQYLIINNSWKPFFDEMVAK